MQNELKSEQKFAITSAKVQFLPSKFKAEREETRTQLPNKENKCSTWIKIFTYRRMLQM